MSQEIRSKSRLNVLIRHPAKIWSWIQIKTDEKSIKTNRKGFVHHPGASQPCGARCTQLPLYLFSELGGPSKSSVFTSFSDNFITGEVKAKGFAKSFKN